MILVTGTGRSGTSTTARILHERLGIPMGPPGGDFDEPNRACPQGSYEDRAFREMHMRLERGQLRFPDFRDVLHRLVEKREEEASGGPWGFKDPRAAELIGLYVAWFNPLVIWCHRDREAVLRSWRRVTTADEAVARERVLARERAMFRVVHSRPWLLRIDFGDLRVDEDYLAGRLQAWLERAGVLEPGSAP